MVGMGVLHLVSTLDDVRKAKVTVEKLHYKRWIMLAVESE